MSQKMPYGERMRYAELICTGTMRNADVMKETGKSSASISAWCKKYTQTRGNGIKRKGRSWFYGKKANGNGTAVAPSPVAATSHVKVSVSTRGEWSIVIGNYRLTLDSEPKLAMLERL